ncbi:hypothetical protein WJX77_002179 [Trebouxia sp. C0004]
MRQEEVPQHLPRLTVDLGPTVHVAQRCFNLLTVSQNSSKLLLLSLEHLHRLYKSQKQVRTAHQLANASKPLLLSCGLVELHVDDIRARANGTDHQRIRLDGKIAVLKRGDLEKGDKRLLSLFKRGDDDLDLQKDGKPAGRLLLININNMVPVDSAQVEVLGPNGETVESFLPEDDGNGLSEELFVYNSTIRVLPFKGLQSAGGILEVLSNYSVVIQHLRNQVVHNHSD